MMSWAWLNNCPISDMRPLPCMRARSMRSWKAASSKSARSRVAACSINRTLASLLTRSDRSPSTSNTIRPRRSDATAKANSASSSASSRSSRPEPSHPMSPAGRAVRWVRCTTSSMMSLPTNSVATGKSARTNRTATVVAVRLRLLPHTIARKGGRLRRAPSRSRQVVGRTGTLPRPCLTPSAIQLLRGDMLPRVSDLRGEGDEVSCMTPDTQSVVSGVLDVGLSSGRTLSDNACLKLGNGEGRANGRLWALKVRLLPCFKLAGRRCETMVAIIAAERRNVIGSGSAAFERRAPVGKHMIGDRADRKFWRIAASAVTYVLDVRTTVRDTLSDCESARQPWRRGF
ncbi:hypothetical protein ABIC17_000981 [Sphingomonas sp. PvP056]